MSSTGQFDNGFDVDSEYDIPALRQAYKSQSKKLKDAEDELASFRTQSRVATLAGLVQEAGFAEGVAKLIPAEIAADSESVGQWLQENGSMFARVTNTPEGDGGGTNTAEETPGGQSFFSEDQLKQAGLLSEASPTPSSGQDVLADLQAKINRAESPEELDTLYGQIAALGK